MVIQMLQRHGHSEVLSSRHCKRVKRANEIGFNLVLLDTDNDEVWTFCACLNVMSQKVSALVVGVLVSE